MKKIIFAVSLLMSCNASFAQSIKNVEEKNGKLHITLDNMPLHMRFEGMKDNEKESIERSKKDGAALQFFLTDGKIVESGVNQDLLVKDVNDFVKHSAKYYKTKPNLKGMQVVTFVLFPGYKKPYQIPLSSNNPQEKEFVNDFNTMLKQASTCNKSGFCAANVLLDSTFVNLEDSTQKLNDRELALFIEKQPTNGIALYTSNKNYLEPVKYILVLGINGYLATEEKIKAVLSRKTMQ